MIIKLNGPMIKPKSGDVKKIVMFLHGYGANGEDLVSLSSVWIDDLPNTLFVSPNAPFNCDFGENSFQWFELQERTENEIYNGLKKIGPILNQFIDNLLKEYNLSIEDLFVVGFSQGTITALYHMNKREKACAGIIGYSGLLFEDKDFENNIKSRPPILLYHGKNDSVIGFESSNSAKKRLEKLGFEVNCIIQDNLEHGIDINGLDEGKKFLKKKINV